MFVDLKSNTGAVCQGNIVGARILSAEFFWLHHEPLDERDGIKEELGEESES